MAGSRVLRSLACFSAAISATESDTRCVVLPRYHTAVLHAASSLLYNVPSTVLVSRCDTANLRTSTLYDVPSTVWFPGATLPSYGPPPSTTSPPSCWFPGATLQSYGPPPSTTSPPPCWFPGATLPSYGHPPSTMSPPSCSSPGVTLLSYGPPPLSATTSPPPFCFPVPPNTLVTTRQASVNSDNLVTLTVPHKATSHPTGNSPPAQNSLRLAYFNAQSCRQKTSEINDLVVDGDFDILLMTETWLYASGDEAYITEMTPSGYLFHSFPRIGRRGGGIAIMFKSALSDSISIPFNSFESVELRLSNDSTSVSVICLYRPPPSKQYKLLNKMFFEEFPTLVSEYSHARRDLAFIGDFNFHFQDSSNGDVDQLKTLLNDHDLVQLVDMPTHKRGHVLDWVIVRRDASCLSLETVEDIALSDHSAIYCSVNVRRPTARKRLVTSRSLRAMNSTDFQADIKSFAETAGDQCADPEFLDVYDTGLRQVLDRHAPLTTRRVSDRPSAPWMTDGIKAAKRGLRRAERQWRDTRLALHREIYTKQRGVVKTLVRAARKLHFSARIENCSNTKQLFSVSSGLLGKSKTTPLPSDIPRSALQDRFCMFFSKKNPEHPTRP